MRIRFKGIAFFLYFLFWPVSAHAYLDPGTGSMLLSAIIGIAATAFFMVKTFFYKITGWYYRLKGIRMPERQHEQIVIYSEGAHYWRTFQPVIEPLLRQKRKVLYLTSDVNDPGLVLTGEGYSSRFIGKGNRAFAVLTMLEADICVTTTPGLDVLQIQRSPGVLHYAYLMHAVTDAAFYKLYSFDYFDSVFCSGYHQIRSIRYLETLRGTEPKQLVEVGCPYLDVLVVEKESLSMEGFSGHRVLIAPTWGHNGLLKRFGLDLLLPLAQSGLPVTIRPHPQSTVAEPDLLNHLKLALEKYSNVQWDFEPNPLGAMAESSVLLSDLSGIVFDYAFVFERPVITVAFCPNLLGMEANDLPYQPWELEILPQLGAHIQSEEITNILQVIESLPDLDMFSRIMCDLRKESVFHFGHCGGIAAEQLIAIQDGLNSTK